MDVEYNLTLADIEEYQLYYVNHSPQFKQRRRMRLITWAIMGLVIVAGSVLFFSVGDPVTGAIFLVLLAVFAAIAYYTYSAPAIRRRIRKMVSNSYGKRPNAVTGHHKLSISPDGITDAGEMTQGTTRWEAIEDIVATDNYLLFRMAGGSVAYIIPRSAFGSETSFNAFLARAQEHKKEAGKSVSAA